ncbi:ATP-binding protein [Streptomyces sp. NPDC059070]|uniref:ATP-binding protein n=1 Tax=Streptomyces sp. NPDC059070 TaxID=3346713 RepID=UPI0036766F3D
MTPNALAQQQGIQTALEMCIERQQPTAEGPSEPDTLWPMRLRRIARASLTHWGRPDLIEHTQLLLTELVTNALRHGRGRDIGIRVFFRDDRCVIEVNDGSSTRPKLRHASPTDEGGRGLLLVDALAESWGVSDDGTTTWCTLPLSKGPAQMQPAAETAPVLRETVMDLPVDLHSPEHARIEARAWLILLSWRGDQTLATDVFHVLVGNVITHALTPNQQAVRVRLAITQADELLIDVTDSIPEFRNFDQAIDAQRSLWQIARRGAHLSWFAAGPDCSGKVVRAVLRPTRMVD